MIIPGGQVGADSSSDAVIVFPYPAGDAVDYFCGPASLKRTLTPALTWT
jgi:hypothetical protein